MAGQATDGIDAPRVEAWFGEHVDGLEPPLAFERISGGRSNLTFSVTDAAGRRWALRRPPLGKRLASAHDMGREFRIISALQGTPVPVAPAVGLCEDDEDPFYVMDWVEGPILRSIDEAGEFPDTTTGGRSASASSTRWSRSTRSIRMRSASASWRRRRTTSPASCTAGRASGKSSTRASCR